MPTRQAHALLHFTVLLWGFTAILGKSISISAVPLVWYRVGLVVVMMGGLMWWRGVPFRLPRRRFIELLLVGVLISAHWLMFYGCIKRSGVSVAVLCLSAVTFFTALLEPIVFRRAVRWYELILGALVVSGVALLVKVETHADALGLTLGVGSAFFSAAFGTVNGVLAKLEPAERISCYELLGALLFTSIGFGWFEFVAPWQLSWLDVGLLLLLAVFCTVFPWIWSLKVVQTLGPYAVALAVSLEPVYSMVMAYVIFPGSEQLTWRFYAGAVVLVMLVVANALVAKWLQPKPRAREQLPHSS